MIVSNHRFACIFTILAVAASSTFAGGTPMEAYGPLDCAVWSLEDALPDDLTQDSSARSGAPKLRQVLSASLQKARSKGGEPVLFLGQTFPKKKAQQPKMEEIHEVGCIRQPVPSASGNTHSLQCFVEMGVHIQTYAFYELPPQGKNALASYACVGECASYPVLAVHEMPWEDGSASSRQKRASAAYAKRCL